VKFETASAGGGRFRTPVLEASRSFGEGEREGNGASHLGRECKAGWRAPVAGAVVVVASLSGTSLSPFVCPFCRMEPVLCAAGRKEKRKGHEIY
jgi:hypothetical protein